MSSREQFMKAVQDDEEFIKLVKQHATKKCSFDVAEVVSELSRRQLEEVWTELLMKTTSTLLSFDSTENEDAEGSSQVENAAAYLQAVVTVATETLSVEEPPNQLLQTMVILHGVLLSLPEQIDRLKNSIAVLCQQYWQQQRDGREEIASQTFIYLLQRSLKPTATLSDVKRVYQLSACLQHINLSSDSSTSLRTLLLQAFIAPVYLKAEEGKRFLTCLFGLNLGFIEELHKVIKTHIPSSPNSVLLVYGEIYFRAWKVASGDFQQSLERDCLQDLMHHAVHARRVNPHALAPQLRNVLSYVHQQKLYKGVDEMLLTLYEPILWRSLKVANADVRLNAAALLFDAFPLQNSQNSNEQSDMLMQKQFDIFNTLLEDPSYLVRVTAVNGVCSVCKVFWELIPAATLKAFIVRLLSDLAWDGAAADVRVAVLKGLCQLLDNPLTHPLLKTVLPQLSNLLHDSSEKVRVTFINLLLRVKSLQAIKFWHVSSMEHLLARLAIDSAPVCRRLTQLLLPSYLPDDDAPLQLARCMLLLKANPAAARNFYRYAAVSMPVDTAVKLIATICKYVQTQIDQEEQQQDDPDADLLQSPQPDISLPPDTETSVADDTELIAGLLESMLILWTGISSHLEKGSNKESKRRLQYRASHMLPILLRTYHQQRITHSLILIAAFLPPAAVPVLSKSMLSKMKALSTEATADDYSTMLEAMCKWGKADDILEVINNCLQTVLRSSNSSTTKTRRSGRVNFCEPVSVRPALALAWLSYLSTHTTCRDYMLADTVGVNDIIKTLSLVLGWFEQGLAAAEPEEEATEPDDVFVSMLETYLKLSILVNKSVISRVLSWAEQQLLPVLSRQRHRQRRAKRQLLTSIDTTLLASEPTGSGYHTETANSTLFSESLLSSGKRPGLDSRPAQLTVSALQVLVHVSADAVLVGAVDNLLCQQLTDFSFSLIRLDECHEFVAELFTLLYQLCELTLSRDMTLTSDVICCLLPQLSDMCASGRQRALQVLPSISAPLSEILTAYYRYHTLQGVVGGGVIMAAIINTMLNDMRRVIQQDDEFEERDNVSELPPLISLLLTLLLKRSSVLRLFINELSGRELDVDSCFAALHLLHPAITDLATDSRKDVLNSIQRHLEGKDQNNVHTLLRKCMVKAGMVA